MELEIDKFLNLSTRKDVFESCVIPTLLYGCQTWSLTSNDKRMLQICQRKMERGILGISLKDRVRNVDVRKQIGARDGVLTVEQLKRKWGGHLAGLEADMILRYDDVGAQDSEEERASCCPKTADKQRTRMAGVKCIWKRMVKTLKDFCLWTLCKY